MSLDLIGRLHLWSNALNDCAECLELAAQLTITGSSEPILSLEKEYHINYELITGRAWSPHASYYEDASILANFKRALPLPRECFMGAMHLRNLAVVYFLQIYTSGRKSSGLVAENITAELDIIRHRMEIRAFPGEQDLKKYKDLKKHISERRNHKIAHAAGAEFGVIHDKNSVRSIVYPIAPEIWDSLARAVQKILPATNGIIFELMGLVPNDDAPASQVSP